MRIHSWLGAVLFGAICLTSADSVDAFTIEVSVAFPVADEFRNFGDPTGPEGIAFVAGAGPSGEDVLYLTQGNECGSACSILAYDTTGARLASLDISPGLGEMRAIDTRENPGSAPTLVVGYEAQVGFSTQRRATEIDLSGAPVAGGIDLIFNGAGAPVINELESLVFDDSTGTLWVGDEERLDLGAFEIGAIYNLQLDGTLISQFDASVGPEFSDTSALELLPNTVVSGDLDPGAFSLIFGDDSSGGNNSGLFLFATDASRDLSDGNFSDPADTPPLDVLDQNLREVTMTAAFQAMFGNVCDQPGNNPPDDPIGDPSEAGCVDPEGLAFDEATGTLWIVSEKDQAVLGFTLTDVVVETPEPASAALLLLGLSGLAILRRRA